MDEKKNNIRLVRSGGRRVTEGTSEYDWSRLEKRTAPSSSANSYSGRMAKYEEREANEFRKRMSYQKKQKQLRLKQKRRRTVVGVAAILVVTFIILFLTPLLDIRSISVEGNYIVTQEQFTEVLKPLVGQNLLRNSDRRIRKMLKTIPYVESADIKKKLFPPSVKIAVKEYTPSAVISAGGKQLVVNAKLHVFSEDGASPLPVPTVRGAEVDNYKIGSEAKLKDAEKQAALETALETIEATGITASILEIDIRDLTNITMNFEDRITIECGSATDLERKLRLFKEAVASNSLADNARGTMDLSETGKAVYTP